MYLVPANLYHRDKRRNVRLKRNPYDEWLKMRHKIREADIRGKSRTKAISEFLRRMMPTSEPAAQHQQQQQLAVPRDDVETPPPPSAEINDDVAVSVPYSMPILLDTQYGIRKDGDIFMIGDSPVYVDTDYKYFTYTNTYRYIDVLSKFVRAYNDTVH
jgi:hypothetical protein